jgi:hypothetical protein
MQHPPIDTDDCAGIRIKMALSTLMPFRDGIPDRCVWQFQIEHEIGRYVRYCAFVTVHVEHNDPSRHLLPLKPSRRSI